MNSAGFTVTNWRRIADSKVDKRRKKEKKEVKKMAFETGYWPDRDGKFYSSQYFKRGNQWKVFEVEQAPVLTYANSKATGNLSNVKKVLDMSKLSAAK